MQELQGDGPNAPPAESNWDAPSNWPIGERTIHAPANWPSEGRVSFEDVGLRYRVGLPRALDGLTVDIAGGTACGVVGRTGAGKSSLVALVLRIYAPEAGVVRIDGIDVASVSLQVLRKRVSMVPQDNVLLSGTVDRNLDPFAEHDKTAKRAALDNAGLGALPLDHTVAADGGSLSAGEKQLLGVARALLRKTRLTVLDEPSSDVDERTDAQVQRVLRESFRGTTTITIAHRLETIIDSDAVLVMDAGRAAEYGPVRELLARPASRLNALLNSLGEAQREALLERAKA